MHEGKCRGILGTIFSVLWGHHVEFKTKKYSRSKAIYCWFVMSIFDPLTTSFLCTIGEKLWWAIFGVVIKLLQSSRHGSRQINRQKSADTRSISWIFAHMIDDLAFFEKCFWWKNSLKVNWETAFWIWMQGCLSPTQSTNTTPNTTNQQHRCCSPTLKNRLKNYENCKNAHNDSRIVCISSQKFESWLICSHALRRKLYEI